MKFLGLTADCVLARMKENATTSVPVRSWIGSVLAGAFGFGAVSVLVFACWAYAGRWFFGHLGEAGTYLAWAFLFMGGAGGLLGRLVIGPGGGRRFCGGFALAFLAYSVVWMAAWFAFSNRLGEVLGALAGTAVFGLLLCAMFRAGRSGRTCSPVWRLAMSRAISWARRCTRNTAAAWASCCGG